MSFLIFKSVFEAENEIEVDKKMINKAVNKVARKHDKQIAEIKEPIVKKTEPLIIETEFGSLDLKTGKFTEKEQE